MRDFFLSRSQALLLILALALQPASPVLGSVHPEPVRPVRPELVEGRTEVGGSTLRPDQEGTGLEELKQRLAGSPATGMEEGFEERLTPEEYNLTYAILQQLDRDRNSLHQNLDRLLRLSPEFIENIFVPPSLQRTIGLQDIDETKRGLLRKIQKQQAMKTVEIGGRNYRAVLYNPKSPLRFKLADLLESMIVLGERGGEGIGTDR